MEEKGRGTREVYLKMVGKWGSNIRQAIIGGKRGVRR